MRIPSPAHVLRPLLWVLLSHSLHVKALEFATFVVCVWVSSFKKPIVAIKSHAIGSCGNIIINNLVHDYIIKNMINLDESFQITISRHLPHPFCFALYGLPFVCLFVLFICHTIIDITNNIKFSRKKKWWGDLTETVGAYERLDLLESKSNTPILLNIRNANIDIQSRQNGKLLFLEIQLKVVTVHQSDA